jgi:glucokinase
MRVLTGDIGGTNARLAVYDVELTRYETLAAETFPSRDYDALEQIVAEFMKDHGIECQRACFGVPGPVKNGRVQTTNLPWLIETSKLAGAAGVEALAVINDLKAQAYGIAALGPEDYDVLNPGGKTPSGNAALIAAGTGLGQAGLYWDGQAYHPFATEGGHSSFGPTGDRQVELLDFLAKRFGHVSWERVVSGPGLANIFEFLLEYRNVAKPVWLDGEVGASGDPAPAITRAALDGRCEICIEALELFVELYGAQAGNLALELLASGGVFVGGGIAPKIIDALKHPLFMNAFLDKGRMRPLLEAMPVRVITNKNTALLGAARFAASLGAAA